MNYGYKPIEKMVKYIHDMNSVIRLGLGSVKQNYRIESIRID